MPQRIWRTWRVARIDLADIGPIDLQEFTGRFRADEPTLLVYQMRELPWTGVAKCAPLGHMLSATEGDFRALFDSEQAWVETLVNERAIHTAFRRELQRASIREDEVPVELLGPYVHRGSYCGDASPFGGVLLGEFRLWGSLVPSAFAEPLIDFYQRQLTQFGRFSFWPAVEGEEDSDEGQAWSEARGRGYLGSRLWHHPTRQTHPNERLRQAALESLRAELQSVITRLEAAEEWMLPLYYHDGVRPVPSFFVGEALPPADDLRIEVAGRVLQNLFDPGLRTPLDAELFAYRARLVRLLGWPMMYRFTFAEGGFRERIFRIARQSIFSGALPYDFIAELLAFKEEMETRYPVLLENPLTRLGSTTAK